MATEVTIGGDGTLFVGEDKVFNLEVLDSAGVPVNITGMTINLVVRLRDDSTDTVFDKPATVVGVYSATRSANTQRARVTLTDTEMNTVKAKGYRHSWKRMDDGSETVISRGPFIPEKATAT